MGDLLWVDPEALRQYAGQVDIAAELISDPEVVADKALLAECMPGSDTAAGAEYAKGVIERIQPRVAGFYSAMSSAVRNSAGEYEAEDTQLAEKLRQIHPSDAS